MEILKTKGREHTDLKGFQQLSTDYPDQTIVDDFHIIRKYDSQEDCEGNCYDWYEIDHHSRYTDKFTPAREEIETGIADSQDAVCMLSEDIEARLAEIEDALCDMSKEDM